MTVVAVGYLADAVAVAAGAAAYPDRVREALNASEVDPRAFEVLKPVASALPYVAALITAVAALVLLGIAASVRAGHFAGRIIAWIAVGLSLMCSFCGLGAAGTPAFSGIFYVSAASRDASGTNTFVQRLPAAYPPAYQYLSAGFALFAMLALIVVVVLLARPSANRFFRPVRQLAPPPATHYLADSAPATHYLADSAPATHYLGDSAPAPVAGAARPIIGQISQLSVLVGQHQRGELTDEEFAAARQQLLGGP
ncbi:SHOCT domain-containing protein [Micromonospora purpureochromogenes]|uniref:SHOCT domain-containing protein n=1 Tax=Micromonospora purpureochromogenes TaxID=47872 RepID=UPI0033FB1778